MLASKKLQKRSVARAAALVVAVALSGCGGGSGGGGGSTNAGSGGNSVLGANAAQPVGAPQIANSSHYRIQAQLTPLGATRGKATSTHYTAILLGAGQ